MQPDGSGADGSGLDRTGAGGIGGIDDADAVLPPPPGVPVDPRDQLWHTASFAAVIDEPAPRRKRKLTAGLACLGAATTAVCGYAGIEFAGIAGLNPPSPPRYVINEQANAQQGDAEPALPEPPPPPLALPQPPVVHPAPRAPAVSAATRAEKSGKDKSDSEKSGRHRKKSKSDD